ncbi:MAG: hypothetical protein KatS3mg131_1564 [Candidatus Tectimicrobiota bacterium]|nr:MAG: hypothetical protein KatS3mg131_1564 [Candidatus Tectomicrobia bacterium]
MLSAAMRFDPLQAQKFRAAGWWTEETLSTWLERQVQERPAGLAVRAGAQTLTYGELAQQAERLAAALATLGLRAGDVVAVQLPNLPEFLLTYLAVCRLGGVLTTLHLPYREAELEALLRHSRARAVVCLPAVKDFPAAATLLALRRRLPGLAHVLVLGEAPAGALSFSELLAAAPARFTGPPPTAEAPFLLLYTSGTTASPKAVPLSYQTMLSNARLSAPDFRLTAADVLLSAAPFTHLFGLYSVHLALWSGACQALLPAFSPDALVATLARSRATVLFAAPAHLPACVPASSMPTTWRRCACSSSLAAPVPRGWYRT